MQGATKEEQYDTLDAFLLGDMPTRDDLEIVDRSSAERAGTCPFQAAVIQAGLVNNSSIVTAAGQECHEAFSRTIREWVECGGNLEPSELRNTLDGNLKAARPDVQPQAIAGARASVYDFSKFLWGIHPHNILRFDGGEDLGRSGQLAMDIEGLNIRFTSEIDLLYSGDSPELLHEKDYKTGWKVHSAADVANSFQFQMHGLLVFENFPLKDDGSGVKGLEVKVWDTRKNLQTFSVIFRREQAPTFKIRLLSALGHYRQHIGSLPHGITLAELIARDIPTWPAAEKCCICDAASLCPVSGTTVHEIAIDPVGAVRKLAALEAKVDAWRTILEAQVDHWGRDIVDDDIAFGRNRPATRRSAASIYTPKQEVSNDGQQQAD